MSGMREKLQGMGFTQAQVAAAARAGCTDAEEGIAFILEGTVPRSVRPGNKGSGGTVTETNVRDGSDGGAWGVAPPASPAADNGDAAASLLMSLNTGDGSGGGSSSGGGVSTGSGRHWGEGGGGEAAAPKKSKWANPLAAWMGSGSGSNDGEKAGRKASAPHSAASSRSGGGGGASTGRRVTIAEDNDEELRRAMELSKRENEEDRALRAAVEASKSEVSGGGGGDGKGEGVATSDVDLRRAIEQSLRDQPARRAADAWLAAAVNDDPRDRRRRMGGGVVAVGDARAVAATPGVAVAEPVGLRNVGNTCYLNSLLQVYFHLPAFRRLIFAFAPSERVAAALAAPRTPTGASTTNAVRSVSAAADDMPARTAVDAPLAAVDPFAVETPKESWGDVGESGAQASAREDDNMQDAPQGGGDGGSDGDGGGERAAAEGSAVAVADVAAPPSAELYSVEFVIELQRLFARMALGNQKYADPTDLLKTMRDANGNIIVIGDQQDASEFNSLFLDIVERALATSASAEAGAEEEAGTGAGGGGETPASVAAAVSAPGSSTSLRATNVVKRMFSASFCQYLSILDPKRGAASPAIEPKHDSTYALFVDATCESNRNLYCGLDDYTLAKIDYAVSENAEVTASTVTPTAAVCPTAGGPAKGGGGASKENAVAAAGDGRVENPGFCYSTPALKSVWFTRFAPVLTIYLSRVRYNRLSSQAEKVHARFLFETEIAIDRYLEQNREVSEKARAMVEKIRHDRAATQIALVRLRRFPGASIGPATGLEPADGRHRIDTASNDARVSSSATTAATMLVMNKADVEGGQDAMSTSIDGSAEDGDTVARSQAKKGGHSLVAAAEDMSTVYARVRRRAEVAVSDSSNFGAESLAVPGMTSKDRDTLVELLDMIASHDRAQVDSLESKLKILAESEVAAYADMDRTKYSLHAVLVHDGEPASGHYWAYIRNKDSVSQGDQWLKFNDLMVTRVSESSMLRFSLGGTGYASAYCLIYALNDWGGKPDGLYVAGGNVASCDSAVDMEIDGQAAPSTVQEFAGILEEGHALLPPARVEEVEESNLRLEQEVVRFIAQKVIEDRAQLARSIVEAAIVTLRLSTDSLRGLMYAERRASAGNVDVVPGRTCGTRSIVEFCLASGARSAALTHALCVAWAVFLSDAGEDERDLLQFVSSRTHVLSSFPPLSGAGGPVGTLESDTASERDATSLLVKEIARLLQSFVTEFPADGALVAKDSLLYVAEALCGSQKLSQLKAEVEEISSFYRFALQVQCIARSAYSNALGGHMGESLGLFVVLLQQDPAMYSRSGASGDDLTEALARGFVCDAKMSLGRRDEEALRFLPAIVTAAALRSTQMERTLKTNRESSTGTDDLRAIAVHLRDLVTVLTTRGKRKRTTASMTGGSLPFVSEALPHSVATEALKALENAVIGVEFVDRVRLLAQNVALRAMQEPSAQLPEECAKSYESARDELCALSCDALDIASAAEAGRKLLDRSTAKTPAA